MATAFADLHSQIRTVVGDTDEIVKVYSIGVLDDQIALAAVILDDDEIVVDESGSGLSAFTTDLSLASKAKVVFKTAEGLIAGVPNEFSYTSPVMRVRRKGLYDGLIRYIRKTLDDLLGDTCPLNFDTEYEVLLNGATKHQDMISDAQGAEL
jgi:hypothetical protein